MQICWSIFKYVDQYDTIWYDFEWKFNLKEPHLSFVTAIKWLPHHHQHRTTKHQSLFGAALTPLPLASLHTIYCSLPQFSHCSNHIWWRLEALIWFGGWWRCEWDWSDWQHQFQVCNSQPHCNSKEITHQSTTYQFKNKIMQQSTAL
jgi:hypothetical protein